MGRKPNQAIRHFFERGPKLNDNSNRYQQTCKRCGEKFEKGRQEALVAHIAKTCQGVSAQERERFVAEVQQPKTAPKVKKPAAPAELPPALPTLSGLEALAEVSRHHGQQSLQSGLGAQNPDFMNHGLPIHTTSTSTSMLSSALPNASSRLAALSALALPQPTYASIPLDSDDSLVDYGHGEAPTIGNNYSRHAPEPIIEPRHESPEPADDLVDYSHGQAPTIEEDYTRHHQPLPVRSTSVRQNSNVDPALSRTTPVSKAPEVDEMKLVAGYVAESNAARVAEIANSMPTPVPPVPPVPSLPFTSSIDVPITSTVDIPNFHFPPGLDTEGGQFQMWNPSGTTPGGPKKVRGAFAPDRRTAVKEVRKLGACLRCRMLKKSCDSADPCKECAKLENARMWKGQCIRTRLSQVFNVFSSTLFMTISHRTMEELRSKTGFTNLPGRLEVSYFPPAGLSVTFPCLRIISHAKNNSKVIINTENEGVGVGSTFDSKISQYGSRLLSLHFDGPRQQFPAMSMLMQHTLRTALTMTSCTLVARAIDLWICVVLLTKPDTQIVAIHEPRLPPTNAPVDLGHDARQQGEGTYYVYIQLRRKLERACDVHFKAIMTELEKSLIQRKQADKFETFIGAIILLRCLEMVGYLYKGFDHLVEPPINAGRRDALYGAESWPLENTPSHYWQQGERFSDLLVSMLKLRKVLPTMKAWEGIIRVGNHDKPVMDFFNTIKLHADVLKVARDRPYDQADPTAWEYRWTGKLFDA